MKTALKLVLLDRRNKTMSNTECAKVFIEAIKTIAEKPENIDNLECYLEKHFDVFRVLYLKLNIKEKRKFL